MAIDPLGPVGDEELALLLGRLGTLASPASLGACEVTLVGALADVERAAAWALRAAVVRARRDGVSWRELSAAAGMPLTTLREQYSAGKGLIVPSPTAPLRVVQAEPDPEPNRSLVPEGEGLRAPGLPPASVDRFVGRERELVDLRSALASERLVTLLGPPGVGKTRLAMELVPLVRGAHRGFQSWVDVAPLVDGALIEHAIGASVLPNGDATLAATDAIAAAAGSQPALLVLDNCEHLARSCADMVSLLLAACPRLRILVTSREPLGVPGETVYPIAPLPVADGPPGSARAADVRLVESIRLFVDRARHAARGFELTDELAGSIAEVCRRLDGLPLAIESAAREVGTLDPPALVERMNDRRALLALGARHGPPRHGSLRAAIAWSYDLLDKNEQSVFRRLSVLRGGAGQDLGSAMCADVVPASSDLWAVLSALSARSMLLLDSSSGRIRMLATLREFGQERLAEAGEQLVANERMLAWLAEAAQPLLTEPTSAGEALARLDEESDNLAHAVGIAERSADHRLPLLAVAWGISQRLRGELAAAEEQLERMLAQNAGTSAAHVLAMAELAIVLTLRGDHSRARRRAAQSLRLARSLREPAPMVSALRALRFSSQGSGDTADAVALQREQVEILRSSAHPTALATALNELAWDLIVTGELDAAEQSLTGALSLLEARGEPGPLAPALHTAGTLALLRGQHDRAGTYYTRALTVSGEDAENIRYNVEGLAVVAVWRGEYARAIRLMGATATDRTAAHLVSDPWWNRLLVNAESTARDRLGLDAAEVAEAAGTALTLDHAREYALTDELFHEHSARPNRPVLTPREREVAQLVAEGLTNAQIATRLRIAPRTVASHLGSVRSKLDLPSRVHVATWLTGRRAPLGALTVAAPPGDPAAPAAGVRGLPQTMSSLIGREQDTAQVTELVGRKRLVTLVGAPGIGKTRLAIAAAAAAATQFADGVVFVPLAEATDAGTVIAAIAQALAVSEVPSEPLGDTVIRHLTGRRLLLVLDNFEQVLPAAPFISEALGAAAGVKALVTSRTRLRLTGEQAYPVPPLALPDLERSRAGSHNLADIITSSAALMLFVTRAREAAFDVQLTPEDVHDAAQLCHRLDGLPLAIELAAAQCDSLTPAELRQQLTERIDVLSGGPQDLPARQRTLMATIEWSFSLLGADEYDLIRRLGVFAGGFDTADVTAICLPGASDGHRTAARLGALVDKSLLSATPTPDGPRYAMLETIRLHARELLAKEGDADELHARHARHFAALAERADRELNGPQQGDWVSRIDRGYPNLQAALGWALDSGQDLSAAGIAIDLARYWGNGHHMHDGAHWCARIIVRAAVLPPLVRAKLLRTASSLLTIRDHLDPVALSDEALRVARELADPDLIWAALNKRADWAIEFGDDDGASSYLRDALDVARKNGKREQIAIARGNLSQTLVLLGDFAAAHELAMANLELERELQNARGVSLTLLTLSRIHLSRGEVAAARRSLEEAHQISQEARAVWAEADILHLLGVTTSLEGDAATAYRLLRDAARKHHRLGDHTVALADLDDLAAALARIDPRRAASILGATDAIRRRLGLAVSRPDVRERAAHAVARVQATLTEGEFTAAHAAWQGLSLEELIEHVDHEMPDDRSPPRPN